MPNITRRQMRTNERLLAALEAGTANPEEFFSGYTPTPSLMTGFGAFLTPLDAARRVVEIARPQPSDQVLDFGAGLGVFAYALLETGVPAGNITAVEHAQALYEIGSQLVPVVTWVGANAFHREFWEPRMGQFDLVIGNPPWGRTRGREPWSPDDARFGDLLLIGNGRPKSAVAEAMSLEVALRVLRPGGRVAFLLPATAFETNAWNRYNREIGPYEESRQIHPIEVNFAHTQVNSLLAVVTRNSRPFPGQVFGEEAPDPDEAQVEAWVRAVNATAEAVDHSTHDQGIASGEHGRLVAGYKLLAQAGPERMDNLAEMTQTGATVAEAAAALKPPQEGAANPAVERCQDCRFLVGFSNGRRYPTTWRCAKWQPDPSPWKRACHLAEPK